MINEYVIKPYIFLALTNCLINWTALHASRLIHNQTFLFCLSGAWWSGKLRPHCWVSPLKASIHWSLFINPISLLYEQWGPNSKNTKKRTVAMLLSCEDGNKQRPSDWKLSLDFHPPPALLKNKNVNKRRQQDGEEHQLGENLRVWERTGRWKGGERLFLSLQTVYITKEESLEHNRAVPRATAQPVLSCCQSVAAAWTLRVFKRPTRLEDYSKARLTCGSAFSKRAPLIKSSLLAVGRINTTTWNRRCSFLLPGGELLEWNARVGAWCGCERGRNWLTNHHPQHKTRSAAHNTLVQKKQKNKKSAGAEIASSQNKLFLCGVQKKKKKGKVVSHWGIAQ